MKNQILFFICLFIFQAPGSLTAQVEFALHLQYNQQLNELHRTGMQNGWGLSAECLSPSPFKSASPIKLQAGARIDINYAGEKGTGIYLEDANELMVRNSNRGAYGIIRLSHQQNSNLQIYLEGLYGVRLFDSYEFDNIQESCPKGPSNLALAEQFTPSWGFTIGSMIHLSEQVAFDIRAIYLQGREVEFVDLESVQSFKGSSYNYSLRSGIASQLMIQLGFNILMIDYNEMLPSQSRKYIP